MRERGNVALVRLLLLGKLARRQILADKVAHGGDEGKGQEDVSDILGGPITLVGAIPELDVVIASLRAAGTDVHPLVAKQPSFFHEDAHGTLAFVATDAEGEESTIDLDKLMTHLTDCTPSFQS